MSVLKTTKIVKNKAMRRNYQSQEESRKAGRILSVILQDCKNLRQNSPTEIFVKPRTQLNLVYQC